MISSNLKRNESNIVFSVYDSYGKEIFKTMPGNNVLVKDSTLIDRLPSLLEKVYKIGREDVLLDLTLRKIGD